MASAFPVLALLELSEFAGIYSLTGCIKEFPEHSLQRLGENHLTFSSTALCALFTLSVIKDVLSNIMSSIIAYLPEHQSNAYCNKYFTEKDKDRK